MIVKNEEKYLDNCLKSMMPLIENNMAELIIVDTGSEDNTIEICKKYTSNIYYKKWNDNFAEMRNYSISKAKGEYIFIQDADQELTKEGVKELINLLKNDSHKKFNTLYINLRNYLNEELTKYSDMKFPLIFKNDGEFKYVGAVHNQPQFKEPILYTNIIVNHFGYIMDNNKKILKFNRTASILKKELEKDPNNVYYMFQLARSYNSIGEHINALAEVKKYISKLDGLEITEDYLNYYRTAAQTYYVNNENNLTIEICDKVLDKFDCFLDCLYLKGLSLRKVGKFEESNVVLKKYLNVLKEQSFLKYNNIEIFSQSSKENVEKIIEDNKRDNELLKFIPTIKENLKLLIHDNILEAINIVNEIEVMNIYEKINDTEFFNIVARVYFFAGEFKKALKVIEDGITKDNRCFDLIYNKAYILEHIGENDKAKKWYILSKEVCEESEVLEEINKKILQLK